MNSRVFSTAFPSAATTLLLGSVLTGCMSVKPDNITDPLYSECEREARLLSASQDSENQSLMDGPDMGSANQAIKDARAGNAEAEATGLAAWPVHALVVRCLAQNGISLTPEQAKTLEEWQERTGIRD
jgi:hypothetical protein